MFFSILSSLVLIALFALFLGDLQVTNLQEAFPGAEEGDVRWFVNTWVLAAIVMITTLTSWLAALTVFVDDRSTGRFNDFIVSPLRRIQVVLGYLLASFLVALVMSLLLLAVSQVYVAIQGDPIMTGEQILLTIGYITVSCAAFSALGSFAVTFMTSTGGFSALSTIVGTLVGFLAGAYLPVGQLPEAVGNGMNALPFAQAAMLIRGPMTERPFAVITESSPTAQDTVAEYYGITPFVGDTEITTSIALAALSGLCVIFTTLAVWRLSRTLR